MLRYAITDRTQLGAQRDGASAPLCSPAPPAGPPSASTSSSSAKRTSPPPNSSRSPATSAPSSTPIAPPPSCSSTPARHRSRGQRAGSTACTSPPAAPSPHATPASFSPDPPPSAQRPPLLSISCHTLEEVRAAARDGVDLILFGPIFGKSIPIPGSSGRPPTRPSRRPSASRPCAPPAPSPAKPPSSPWEASPPPTPPSALHAGAAGIAGIRLFQQLEDTRPESAPAH